MQNGYNALTKEQKNSFIQSFILHLYDLDTEEVEGLHIEKIEATGKESIKVEFNNKEYHYKNGERW